MQTLTASVSLKEDQNHQETAAPKKGEESFSVAGVKIEARELQEISWNSAGRRVQAYACVG